MISDRVLSGRHVTASRASMEARGWTRVDGGKGKLGAVWVHRAGWELRHCGHPTAHYPWSLYNPAGETVAAPNGRAWPNLEMAARWVVETSGPEPMPEGFWTPRRASRPAAPAETDNMELAL